MGQDNPRQLGHSRLWLLRKSIQFLLPFCCFSKIFLFLLSFRLVIVTASVNYFLTTVRMMAPTNHTGEGMSRCWLSDRCMCQVGQAQALCKSCNLARSCFLLSLQIGLDAVFKR